MGGHIILRATIVTNELVEFQMEGEGHVALRATRRPPAASALQRGTVAAPIEEKDGLSAGLQSCLHFVVQTRRERRGQLLLSLQFRQIFDHDLGHLHPAKALCEAHQGVFARFGVLVTLERGGGGAE